MILNNNLCFIQSYDMWGVGHRGITNNRHFYVLCLIHVLTFGIWNSSPTYTSKTIRISGVTASNETWIFDDFIVVLISGKHWIIEDKIKYAHCITQQYNLFVCVFLFMVLFLRKQKLSKNKNWTHSSLLYK